MRLEIEREKTLIYPETIQDEVYLEEVLILKREGNECSCTRRNRPGNLAKDMDWPFVIELKARSKQ